MAFYLPVVAVAFCGLFVKRAFSAAPFMPLALCFVARQEQQAPSMVDLSLTNSVANPVSQQKHLHGHPQDSRGQHRGCHASRR